MKLFVVLVFLFLLAVEAKGLEKLMSGYVDFDMADISDGGKRTDSRIKKRSVITPKEVLEYLNEVRGKVKSKDMRELNWNYTLAKRAKALVTTCEFRPTDRPTRPQYGRVIHSSFGKTKAKDYKGVVDAWYEGTKNFYPSSPKCAGLCTDYLMLTRSDFDRVGCAANECDDLRKGFTSETDALFMACYFFSTLNDSFLQPNSKGDHCAECGAKFKLCRGGLCTKDHPKPKYSLKNSNGKMKRSKDEDNPMSTKDNTMSTKDNTLSSKDSTMSTKDNTMSTKDNTMSTENMSTKDQEKKNPGSPEEVTKKVDSPGDPTEKLPDIPEATTTKKIPPRPPGEDLPEIAEGVPVMPTTTKGPEEIPEREPPDQKISFAPVAPIKSGVQLGIQKISSKLLILNILLVIGMTKSV